MDIDTLPTIEDVFSTFALYRLIPIDDLQVEDRSQFLEELRRPTKVLDAFCVECRKDSTFIGAELNILSRNLDAEEWAESPVFGVEFLCSRDSDHRMYFIFRPYQHSFVKIGQHPSIADQSTVQIKDYWRLLGDERYGELHRAIGLFSHGVGVGSFVYLRRILESLISDAHDMASLREGWDDSEYQRAGSAADRIGLLGDILPSFLVMNKDLYGILSKGIHSLSEKECLSYFPAVRWAIELILDQRLEQRKQEKKLDAARKSLDAIRRDVN